MKTNKKKHKLLTIYRNNLQQDIRTFAKGCGIGENLLGKYENGYCIPSLMNFCKIMRYLHKNKIEVDTLEFMYNLVETKK